LVSEEKRGRDQIRIEVQEAHESTIIGVKSGPDLEEIRHALREEFTALFRYSPNEIREFRQVDPVAEALFACESPEASALGFAVNNSGLIVCSSVVRSINSVRHLSSGRQFSATSVERGNMLQALAIRQKTRGLIPSYRPQPELDEKLFAFNDYGKRCDLSVDATHLCGRIEGPEQTLLIEGGFMARFARDEKIIGGPVMNEACEVMGIAIGASRLGYLVVQPWFQIGSCIQMNAKTIDE